MYKKLLSILFVFVCSSIVMAQDDYHKVDVFAGFSLDIAKNFEGDVARQNFKGFDTSAAYNFTKYLGAKVEFSGHRASQQYSLPGASFTSTTQGQIDFAGINTNGDGSSYKFMGGIQIKNNSKEKKFKPFRHVLAGAVRQKLEYTNLDANYQIILGGKNSSTNNRFTWDLGGGIDIKVHRRINIRVIQFDFNSFNTKAETFVATGDSRTFPAGTRGIGLQALTASGTFTATRAVVIPSSRLNQKHFTFGFGIVFH